MKCYVRRQHSWNLIMITEDKSMFMFKPVLNGINSSFKRTAQFKHCPVTPATYLLICESSCLLIMEKSL